MRYKNQSIGTVEIRLMYRIKSNQVKLKRVFETNMAYSAGDFMCAI